MDIFFQNHKKLIFWTIILIVLSFAFAYLSSVQNLFYFSVELLEKYAQKNEYLSQMMFLGISAVSAMIAFASSVPLVPVAIKLWGGPSTFVLLLTGWTIGHIISYSIGYWSFYSLLGKLSNIKKINSYKAKISGRLNFPLVALFCFAMPAEIPGYTLGLLRYSFWKYFLAIFYAELPFAIISVYAGEAILAQNPILLISLIFAGFLIIAVMFAFFRRKLGL